MSLSISPTEQVFRQKDNEGKAFELYNLPKYLRIYLLKSLPPKDRASLFALCRKTRDAFFPIQEMWQGRSFDTMTEIEDLFNQAEFNYKIEEARTQLVEVFRKSFDSFESRKLADTNFISIREKLEKEHGLQQKPARRCYSLFDLFASMHRLCISPTDEQIRLHELEKLSHKSMEVFRQSNRPIVSEKCIKENSVFGLAIVARHIKAQKIRYKLSYRWNDKVVSRLLQLLPQHCLPFILSIPNKAANENSPDKYYASEQPVVKVGESRNNHARLLTRCWMTNQPSQIMRQALLDWTNYASKKSPFKVENHHMWGHFQNEILFALLIDITADNLDFRKKMFTGILTECQVTSLGMFRATSSTSPVHLTLPIFRTICEENFRLVKQLYEEGPKYAFVPYRKNVVILENSLYDQLHKLRIAFEQNDIGVLECTWDAISKKDLDTHSITFFWMLCGLLHSLNPAQIKCFAPFIQKVCLPYMETAILTTIIYLAVDQNISDYVSNDLKIVLSYLKLKLNLSKKGQ